MLIPTTLKGEPPMRRAAPVHYYWKPDVNYRVHPELYKVGKGEQGVLICEPYKSEILPHWKFKTPEIAKAGSTRIFQLFKAYLEKHDFVGADMARKFLQMGYTRARRYCNYKGGRKYDAAGNLIGELGTGDPLKAESASIYYKKWRSAENDPTYKLLKSNWKQTYG